MPRAGYHKPKLPVIDNQRQLHTMTQRYLEDFADRVTVEAAKVREEIALADGTRTRTSYKCTALFSVRGDDKRLCAVAVESTPNKCFHEICATS